MPVMLNAYTEKRAFGKTVDWWIIGAWLCLVIFGWMNIFASVHGEDFQSIFDFQCRSGKQLVWIGTALILAIVIIFILSPAVYEPLAPVIYGITLILLVAVIFLGRDVKGSHSWFTFGPVSFQPAEISKIATSLMLSKIMSRQNFKFKGRDLLNVAATILVPMAIIMLEKETGSALIYASFIFMLYREGLSGWLLGAAGLAVLLVILTLTLSPFYGLLVLSAIVILLDGAFSGYLTIYLLAMIPTGIVLCFIPAPANMIAIVSLDGLYLLFSIYRAYRFHRDRFRLPTIMTFILGAVLIFSVQFIHDNVLRPHQKERIEVLLGIKEDVSGAGYNVHQSMIAIGSGGFSGKGYCHGTQTAYGFVPEQSTDFIFCTVGEEWGWLGCMLVLGLYCLIIIRLIKDAEHSRTAFTRIYGYCVAGILFTHLFINVGMTVGLMPVIGIPLPFMSYGGSSLWGFTIMLSIFVALYRAERKYF